MPGIDKATGRVVALIVLLVLGAAGLRGYLPDSGRPDQASADNPASLFAVVALLGVTLGIVAVAIIARLRDRRTASGNLARLAQGAVGRGGRPSWRVLLIGLGVIVAWLLLVTLLMYLVRKHDIAELAQLPGPDATPEGSTATPVTRTPQPEPQPPEKSGGNVFGYLAASAVAMVLLIVAAVVIGVRDRLRVAKLTALSGDHEKAEAPAAVADSDSLVRAAELGLAEVGDLGRGPREAIIACYATMERELAQVPDAAPQDYDTPSEVLARAVDHHALGEDNAARLVQLFTEARFSPHVMNEDHREAAVAVLHLVLAELPRIPT